MSLHIRPAKPGDALAVASLRVASWQSTYRGIMPDTLLDAMDPQTSLDHLRDLASGAEPGSGFLVGEEDNRIVGFAIYGAARAPSLGYSGELRAIYWLPEAMGKGYGSQMMAHIFEGLRCLRHSDMIVWVMEANTRGRSFYEHRVGATLVENSRKSFERAGATLWEVAYGLRPLPAIR